MHTHACRCTHTTHTRAHTITNTYIIYTAYTCILMHVGAHTQHKHAHTLKQTHTSFTQHMHAYSCM
jgi:hypothetical protein